MKRKITTILLIIFIMNVLQVGITYAEGSDLGKINGKYVVSINYIFGKLGAKITFTNNIYTITKDKTIIKLTVNSDTAIVNNKKVQMETPVKYANSIGRVSMKFVEQYDELFGYKVTLNTANKNIVIEKLTTNKNNEPIVFADKNLEKKIRNIIGKSDGPITAADVSKITCLDLHGTGIKNVDALKYFTNLKKLWLPEHSINNIEVLVNALPGLEELEWLLAQDADADLSYLSKLSKIKVLCLGKGMASYYDENDISFLKGMKNLEFLYLSGFWGSDFAYIKDLKKLRRLTLDCNRCKNVEVILDLPELRNLSLEHVTDISFVGKMTKLEKLHILSSNAANIAPLKNLLRLEYLELWGNNISDITPLQNLTNLKYLRLAENNISNILPLQSLTNLGELDLARNQISDISALGNLTKLSYLDLSSNKIVDITPLNALTKLRSLILEENEIEAVKPLKYLIHLNQLYLAYNKISDIEPLTQLPELYTLTLYGNRINDLTPIKSIYEHGTEVDFYIDENTGEVIWSTY